MRLASNPVLVGAVTVLVTTVAVFLAYNANNGLPFVPTETVKVRVANGANLIKGNEVRSGGSRIGVVSDMRPVALPNGTTGAELTMELDKSYGDVPRDSTVRIRPRSALGLKYVELTRGTNKESFKSGDVLPESQASASTELDDVFKMFDEKTRKAEQQNFIVIEDDYEAENLYEGAPMPALKSLDKAGRVVYVGSISKSLSPVLRLGYIVAPRALIRELRLIRHAMLRHPSTLLQQAYAMFLSLGHHESHARRVNLAMQERLGLAAQALRTHLPDFEFMLPQGGASIWVQAPAWVDAGELALMARGRGVLIEAGDVFFLNPPYPCPFFRLRLSSIPAQQIPAGIHALALAVEELAQARGEPRAPLPRPH